MNILCWTVTAAVAAALLAPAACAAGPQRPAEKACTQAVENIRLLVDFARSHCISPLGGELTLVFAEENSVYRIPPIREAYLAVLVAAAADAVRSNPRAKIVAISFMDKDLGLQRRYWTISAAEAMKLQAAIQSDQITWQQFIAGIAANGRLIDLPAKK